MKAFARSAAVCAVAMMNLLKLSNEEASVNVVENRTVSDDLPSRNVDQVVVELVDREGVAASVVGATDEADHAEDKAPVCEVQIPAHVLHEGDRPVPVLEEFDDLLLGRERQVRGCERR